MITNLVQLLNVYVDYQLDQGHSLGDVFQNLSRDGLTVLTSLFFFNGRPAYRVVTREVEGGDYWTDVVILYYLSAFGLAHESVIQEYSTSSSTAEGARLNHLAECKERKIFKGRPR